MAGPASRCISSSREGIRSKRDHNRGPVDVHSGMQSESDSVNVCFLCCRREAKNDVIAVLGFWRLEFWELDELPYATISVTLPGHPYLASCAYQANHLI
jgi:hypothetical protein